MYTKIVMCGKSGQGKSITANKLLGIEYGSVSLSTDHIKEWSLEIDGTPYLASCKDKQQKCFMEGPGQTTEYHMLTNENTKICILDIPGFMGGEQALRVLIKARTILHQLNISDHIFLYFLPFRGSHNPDIKTLEEELCAFKTLYHDMVFRHMIVVATRFDSICKISEKDVVITAFRKKTGSDSYCPPIIFISQSASPEMILNLIQSSIMGSCNESEMQCRASRIKQWFKMNTASVQSAIKSAITDRPNMHTISCSHSHEPYYIIVLLGKSGSGKSTTANKLLDIDCNTLTSQHSIYEWKCTDSSILKWCGSHEQVAFKPGEGARSVTAQCQMLSNEHTKICVIDAPGFADTRSDPNLTVIQRNAGLIDTIVAIQTGLKITFHRIVYFLPTRGVLERADGYLQLELSVLFYYFGRNAFNCMVIVATMPKKKNKPQDEYEEDYMLDSKDAIILALKEVMKKEDVKCPPIVYIPFNATSQEILKMIQDAPLQNSDMLGPSQMITMYSGEGSWEEWLNQFATMADERALDNIAKLELLKMKLIGKAKVLFDQIVINEGMTFESATLSLQMKLYTLRFEASVKRVNEDWNKFCTDLCSIAQKAFPNLSEKEREQLIVHRILEVSNYKWHLQDPVCLQHLLTILSAKEMITETYTGEDDTECSWESWIEHFEIVVLSKGLDNGTKLRWLSVCLSGKAFAIFNSLTDTETKDFVIVKDTICRKFNVIKFKEKRKWQGERWDKYFDDLTCLAIKAFPKEEVEKEILDHVKSQVSTSVLLKTTCTWNSLDDMKLIVTVLHEIPDVFDDQSLKAWNEWIAFFECVTTVYSLDDTLKLKWLSLRLGDKLLQLCNSILNTEMCTFSSAKLAIESILYKQQFESRDKDENEDWEEFCEDLKYLLSKSDPTLTEEEQSSKVLSRFMSVVHQKNIHLLRSPETIDEALAFVIAQELIPVPFSSNENFEKWIAQFSICVSQKQSIADSEKLLYFSSRLMGDAQTIYEQQQQHHSDFKLEIEEFQRELYKKDFKSRQKTEKESWKSYCDVISALALKIICDYSSAEEQILQQLVSQMAEPLKSRQWNSFNEAVVVASVIEAVPNTYSAINADGWEEWIANFEVTVGKFVLESDDETKLVCFTECLDKGALDVFNTLNIPFRKETCFLQVKKSFEIQLYQNQFMSKVKSLDEDWNQFLNTLNAIAKKAYPDMLDVEIDALVFSRLTEIMNQCGIKFHCSPEASEEAVTFAHALQVIKEPFDLDDNWEKWIENFEHNIADKMPNVTEGKKLQYLHASLINNAKAIYDDVMKGYCKAEYNTVRDLFQMKLYQMRFKSRSKSASEKWSTYSKSLSMLATKAYPNETGEKQDNEVLKKLLLVSQLCNLQISGWCLECAVPVISAIKAIPVEFCDGIVEQSAELSCNWEEWISIFESNTTELDENKQKLSCLEACLKGDARQMFDALPIQVRSSYKLARETFQKSLYKATFYSRNKKLLSEYWDDVLNDLCILANKADTPDCKVMEQILLILKNMHIKCPLELPNALDDIVIIVAVLELKMKPYDREDKDWENWINKFDLAVGDIHLRRQLSDKDKLMCLRYFLSGKPLSLFQELPESDTTCFNTAKMALKTKIYIFRFDLRIKCQQERWKDFADDLVHLAKDAFPNRMEKIQDEKVLNKIISCCKCSFKDDLIYVSSVNDAVNIVSAWEVIPVRFSGKGFETWKDWLINFENQAQAFSLEKNATLLHACLSDDARDLFASKVSHDEKKDYCTAKLSFEKALYTYYFEHRARRKKEFLTDLIQNLQELADKAFAGEPDRDAKVLSKLVDLMKAPREGVLNIDFDELPLETLEQAVVTFTALDAMKFKQYHDGEDWDEWIQVLERTINMQVNLMDDDSAKLGWLKACLTGKSKDFLMEYYSMHSHDLSFACAKSAVETAMYRNLFETRTKDNLEGWNDLAENLTLLAQRAFPLGLVEERDAEVLKRFLIIVGNPRLNQQKPTNAKSAVAILEYLEASLAAGVTLKPEACTKCAHKVRFGENKPTAVEDSKGNCVAYDESKCHPKMVPKYTITERGVGGMKHTCIATLGTVLCYEKVTGKEVWPGFNNSDKVCIKCGKGFGYDGCCTVDTRYECHYDIASEIVTTKHAQFGF